MANKNVGKNGYKEPSDYFNADMRKALKEFEAKQKEKAKAEKKTGKK